MKQERKKPFDQRLPQIIEGINKIVATGKKKPALLGYTEELQNALGLQDGFVRQIFEGFFLLGIRTAMEGISPATEATRADLEIGLRDLPQGLGEILPGTNPAPYMELVTRTVEVARNLSYKLSTKGQAPSMKQMETYKTELTQLQGAVAPEQFAIIAFRRAEFLRNGRIRR